MPTITLIRGLPGSGKSTLAKQYKGKLIEADQFFIGSDGTYRFVGSKLSQAHAWCFAETEILLREGQDVVVANVFGQRWQIQPYFELAEKLNLPISVIKAEGSYGSIHDVPSHIIKAMADRWQVAYGEVLTLKGNIVSVQKLPSEEWCFQVETQDSFSDNEPTSKCWVRVSIELVPQTLFQGETVQMTGVFQLDGQFDEAFLPNKFTRIKPYGIYLSIFLKNYYRFYRINAKKFSWLVTHVPALLDVLDSKNSGAVISSEKGGLSESQANLLFIAWAEYTQELQVEQWLRQHELSLKLSRIISYFWGESSLHMLTQNPYRLLPFLSWQQVDALALNQLEIASDDKNRVRAAIEEVCNQHFNTGNTLVKRHVLEKELGALISLTGVEFHQFYESSNSHVVLLPDKNSVQLKAANRFELFIKNRVSMRTKNRNIAYLSEKIPLALEQGRPLRLMLENPVSAIFGEKGTGKLTLIDVICSQLRNEIQAVIVSNNRQKISNHQDQSKYHTYSLADIAKLVLNDTLLTQSLYIIEDADAYDLSMTYWLLKAIPECCHICFIGDIQQCPPIGAGLVFHKMYGASGIPQIELTRAFTSKTQTDLTSFAFNLLEEKLKGAMLLSELNSAVSYTTSNDPKELLNAGLAKYREFYDQGGCQVLSESYVRCNEVNEILSAEYRQLREYKKQATPLISIPMNNSHEKMQCITLGEPLIWQGVNDSRRGIYQGMHGILSKIYDTPEWKISSSGTPELILAEADFSGVSLTLTEYHLASLRLAYCVPCTKTQSSSDRLVVFLDEIELLNRLWLYTAITKGHNQVAIIGCIGSLDSLLFNEFRAPDREVGLEFNIEINRSTDEA